MNLYTTVITQKGQMTIPKEIRDQLGIKSYEKVRIVKEKDHLKVFPTIDILDIAGKFKVKNKTSVLKAREAIHDEYSRK